MRKKEIVEIPDGFGRDSTPRKKVFLIEEWPADRAEKWGIRAMLAYNQGSRLEPSAVVGMGMEGIFIMGVQVFLNGSMDAEKVIPLLDELLDCVKMIRDPKKQDNFGNPIATALIAEDIEEVSTRMWLRSEVIRVHTGFSPADALLSLISVIMTTQPSALPNIQTSRH
jgi:hypothetical protein